MWLLLAGRGYGKTRTGAEYVRRLAESGRCRRIALVAPTAADARNVMVEGESGLLNVCPAWHRPLYEPSKNRLTWSNGAIATTYSADEPERLRGPQHDAAWADELAAWRHAEYAWDMLMFGLRIGDDPRCVATTTPKPAKIVKDLLASDTTALTHGTTYENRAHLAPAFFAQIITRYEGTRLGRQELNAEILEDTEGALWTRTTIENSRYVERVRRQGRSSTGDELDQQIPTRANLPSGLQELPELVRIVVGVDPAVSSGSGSDETGIIVCGRDASGRAYVLDDRSCVASPDGWAQRVVGAFADWGADLVVAETNNGGDLVPAMIRTVDPTIPIEKVTASRGKYTRAEPVAALYEQGRVHHVGTFPALEDQMTTWVPGEPSPDRMDALVWALTRLMLTKRTTAGLFSLS